MDEAGRQVSEAPPSLGIRVAGGVTVAVPARIDLLTPYVLLEQEDWFEDEIRFLRRALRPGMRAVDIGANYGLYSLSLAAGVGPAGRVWAVEPASATAAYLRHSVELNGFEQVHVIRTALSDRTGTARLSIEANAELNSLSDGGGHGATEEVPLTTLDALAAEYVWGAVDFLKLDAEGEEERIVSGGAAFLRSASPLVMFEIRHGDRLNLGLVDGLAAAGYACHRLVPGLGLLVPWDPAAPLDPFQLNLFACRPDRAEQLEREGLLERRGGRHAGLRAAFAKPHGEDASGLYSKARLARDLGDRQQAVDLLDRALGSCARADPLFAVLLEELVTLSTFSTYFTRGTPLQQVTLDRLEALKATGRMTAPMERRRQLMRVLAGLQAGPVPAPLLAVAAPDNLNPELWQG
jgi:FkbM family methyltransferase